MPWCSFSECWALSQLFHYPLSLSSRGSSLSAIRVYHLHIWGYWYFSQQSWFQLMLNPAQRFSWCTLHRTALTYSFSYLEPFCCSMSSSNCCFLTCIQVSQEAGQVVWYSRLFQNFPQFIVIHTVKVFTLTQTLFWVAKRKSRATQLSMTMLTNEFRVVSGPLEQKSCHL